jgi:ribosomal-protein-alanine N-acetyltransferase
MHSFSFTPFPELVTPRLTLRQPGTQDAHDLFLLRSDEEVNKYLTRGRLQSVEEAEMLIEKLNNGIASDEWVFWIMSYKDSGKMAGTICLWNINREQQKAETGYMLCNDAIGKGLMQEALSEVIDYGFEQMRLQTIEAYTHPNNDRSTALLLRNHFKKQGMEDGEPNAIFSLTKV